MKRVDPDRLRHSKALDGLTPTAVEEYRALCLDQAKRLRELADWLAERGLRVGLTAISGDVHWFRVQAVRERLRSSAAVARQIDGAAADPGSTARSGRVLAGQLAFDWLAGQDHLDAKDLVRFTELVKGILALEKAAAAEKLAAAGKAALGVMARRKLDPQVIADVKEVLGIPA